MFYEKRRLMCEKYNEARDYFINNPANLINLEHYVTDIINEAIVRNYGEIEHDYNEASFLNPFWANYPPDDRGRAPVGDQIPWIEVGEHSVGHKLNRIISTEFDIREVGLPSGADNRFTLSSNDILEMTEESMDRLLSINLKGTFFLTQYAANKMIENNCGEAIINITSMSAYVSSTSRGEYCISKAGLAMVTALFADRLAEYGINVYELRPGIIETDMTAKVKDKYQKLISEGILPIKRMGEPNDIARAVLGIAEGMIRYSTGEVINIDGGYHLRRL